MGAAAALLRPGRQGHSHLAARRSHCRRSRPTHSRPGLWLSPGHGPYRGGGGTPAGFCPVAAGRGPEKCLLAFCGTGHAADIAAVVGTPRPGKRSPCPAHAPAPALARARPARAGHGAVGRRAGLCHRARRLSHPVGQPAGRGHRVGTTIVGGHPRRARRHRRRGRHPIRPGRAAAHRDHRLVRADCAAGAAGLGPGRGRAGLAALPHLFRHHRLHRRGRARHHRRFCPGRPEGHRLWSVSHAHWSARPARRAALLCPLGMGQCQQRIHGRCPAHRWRSHRPTLA